MKFYLPHDNMYTPEWRLLDLMLHLSMPIDRSNVIDNFGFEYAVQVPIPLNPYTPLSFAEIADQQAASMYMKRSNPILIMWSGGLDSTTIIAAFIKLGVKFTVGYTSSSKDEYPWLFNEMQSGEWPQITMLDIGDVRISELQNSYHVITGGLADQLFGGENMFERGSDFALHIRPQLLLDYKAVMPPFILSFFQKSIDAFPIEIKDFCDFLWWLNFNLKYQFMIHSVITYTDADTTRSDSFSHFFEGDDFQCWAMTNRALNKEFAVHNNFALYKNEARLYMFEVFKDLDYIETKRKVSSVAAHYGEVIRETRPRIIDVDGKMQILES